MKKILYFSILNLFFSCYLQAQQASQASGKTKQSKASVSKQSVNKTDNRNLANNQNILSKADVLGEDYYKDLESEPIIREVNIHLQAIVNICETKNTLGEKVDSLNSSFQSLKDLIAGYLGESNLSTNDGLLLRGIRSNIAQDRISYGQPITEELVGEVDIKNQFLIAYHVHYNLPDNTPVEKFPDEWAKQIYAGLDCLYKK